MKTTETVQKDTTLERYGLKDVTVNWNLSPEDLQKITIEKGMGNKAVAPRVTHFI